MLTFRNTAICYILLNAGLLIYDYQHPLSAWFYIVPFLIVSLIVAWGCYFIQSGFFLKAYCDGDVHENKIALTFDDGPHEATPVILDLLKQFNAKAAFFCIGKNIPGKEHIVRRIAEEGHVVGNHSFSHSNMIDFFPIDKLTKDVSKTDDLIYKTIGKRSRLFRPPYGVTTPVIARLVKKKKYDTIGWNVRSYDTSIKDKDRLMKRIFTQTKNGSVILLHDSTPGIEIVLQKILEHTRQKNLRVVGIEELFKIKAYESI
jgi:peptidoglycan/xylan/chitin deacetylase (PgdA/CDA1 family)